MEDKEKEILISGLHLLYEDFKKETKIEIRLAIFGKMIEAIRALYGIQSFYEDDLHHPYVVQLPVKDLVDLYAVRAEWESRRG